MAVSEHVFFRFRQFDKKRCPRSGLNFQSIFWILRNAPELFRLTLWVLSGYELQDNIEQPARFLAQSGRFSANCCLPVCSA